MTIAHPKIMRGSAPRHAKVVRRTCVGYISASRPGIWKGELIEVSRTVVAGFSAANALYLLHSGVTISFSTLAVR